MQRKTEKIDRPPCSIIFLLNLVVLDGPSFESQTIGTVIAGSSSWNIKKFLPH